MARPDAGLAVAHHAEAVGLDSAWMCDHLLSEPSGQPVQGHSRGVDAVVALAASTSPWYCRMPGMYARQ
jgi:alkanesulfonate monooxygenase SsuD/methylene tetrahydromethanopterin reductase-like flavin-dependent oxidoreductase (luciferase family)